MKTETKKQKSLIKKRNPQDATFVLDCDEWGKK